PLPPFSSTLSLHDALPIYGNRLDFTEPDPERRAVTNEDGRFRPRVEQHRVALAAGVRDQSQAEAEICAEQRFAGNDAGASEHDIDLKSTGLNSSHGSISYA